MTDCILCANNDTELYATATSRCLVELSFTHTPFSRESELNWGFERVRGIYDVISDTEFERNFCCFDVKPIHAHKCITRPHIDAITHNHSSSSQHVHSHSVERGVCLQQKASSSVLHTLM